MTYPVSPYLGTFNLAIPGTSSVVNTQVFYEFGETSGTVANFFVQNMSVLYEIFNRPVSSNGASNPPLSGLDLQNVVSALTNLYNVAQGNLTQGPNPINIETFSDGRQKLFYLTKEMVTSLDVISRSIQATGGLTPSTMTLNSLQLWKDFSLVTPEIENALAVAMRSATLNRSIQAFIEMDYVDAGNTLIESKLTSLESAVGLTTDVLNVLADIQNAKNQVITIQRSKSDLPYPLNSQISDTGLTGSEISANNEDYANDYQSLNSVFYTSPQFPVPNSTLIKYSTKYFVSQQILIYFNNSAGSLRLRYSTFIQSFPLTIKYEGLLVPRSITAAGRSLFLNLASYQRRLQAYLPQLLTTLGASAAGEPNSLYSKAQAVYNNLSPFQFVDLELDVSDRSPGVGILAGQRLFQWLTDGNKINPRAVAVPTTVNPGDIQQNISAAITSAEGLNDTQKEAVRNFLFVFEEFYKSASAALQRISQMIEKMATNISR